MYIKKTNSLVVIPSPPSPPCQSVLISVKGTKPGIELQLKCNCYINYTECQSWKGKWGTQEVKCLLMGYRVIHLLKAKSDSAPPLEGYKRTYCNTASLAMSLGLMRTNNEFRINESHIHSQKLLSTCL